MPFKDNAEHRERCKQYHLKNPLTPEQKTRRAARERQRRNSGPINLATLKSRTHKAILVEYKGGRCTDCLGVFPLCCYDFDHLRDKKFEIAPSLCRNIEVLKTEADKCELVCSNCHRIRTQSRLGVF